MNRSRTTAGLIAALFALQTTAPAFSAVDEEEMDRKAEAIAQAAARELLPQVDEEEKKRHALILDGLSLGGEKTGSWQALGGKTPLFITRREAVMSALARNLSIESGRDDVFSAEQALEEAKAVFIPNFSLAMNFTQTDTYRRARVGRVNKRRFNASDVTDIPAGSESPAVTSVIFRTQAAETNVSQEIEASSEPKNGPTDVHSFTLSVTQPLPWGPTLSVSSVTNRQKVFYKTGHYWKDGMYSSTLTLNLSSGLPGFKDFGPYAPTDAAIKIAEKTNEIAKWALFSTINSILSQTDSAYWTLTQALETLFAAEANRDLITRQKARVERLFSKQRATTYERAEMDAELANAEIAVEQARESYLIASNALAQLVEHSEDAIKDGVYLPYAYAKAFKQDMPADYDKALATAREFRADYKIGFLNVDSGLISYKAAENQALPDVDVSASLTSSQNGTTFGFRDPWHSITNLNRPDTRTESLTLSYRWPWMNRAADADLVQARHGLNSTRLSTGDVDKSVRKEIADALSGLGGARIQLEEAEREIKALQETLETLSRRRELGADYTQNEFVLTNRNLHSAKLKRIAAQISGEIWETALLAAQGTLATDYGMVTAINETDRHRVKRLAEFGMLSYFGRAVGLIDDDLDAK